MAEQKRGGFHALEERIHRMEADDVKEEEARRASREDETGGDRGEPREDVGRTPPGTRK